MNWLLRPILDNGNLYAQKNRELRNGPGWWEPCGFKQAQNWQSSENRFSPSAELAPCSTGNVFNFHKSGLSDQVLL